MKTSVLAALAFVIVAAGCAPPAEEITTVDSTKVAFEGAPDERFVGAWKSTSSDSTYTMSINGTYQLHSRVKMPGGPGMIDADSKGEWRLKDKQLIFKDGQGNVVPYDYTLEGDTLTFVSTGKMKNKTVLKKQVEDKKPEEAKK